MDVKGYKIISDNIAWDEKNQYSCRRCGKAGYKSPAAVKGHLGNSCRGKAVQKGIQSAAASYSPAETTQKANLRDFLAGLPATTDISNSQLDSIVSMLDRVVTLDGRVGILENEYNHMVIDKNQNNTTGGLNGWIEANKDILIIIGVIVGLVLVFRESKCDCGKRSSLGSDLIKTASTYGIKKIFK